jgi:hypothetical protein
MQSADSTIRHSKEIFFQGIFLKGILFPRNFSKYLFHILVTFLHNRIGFWGAIYLCMKYDFPFYLTFFIFYLISYKRKIKFREAESVFWYLGKGKSCFETLELRGRKFFFGTSEKENQTQRGRKCFFGSLEKENASLYWKVLLCLPIM